MKHKGLLITFEGIDGSGKTTQLKRAEEFLTENGFDVLTLREPGSTSVAEKIRSILLDSENSLTSISELLLFLAARSDLVDKVILPELRKGTIILCDRFFDSTTAYQGYGRGLDLKMVKRLNEEAVGEAVPDLTFLINIKLQTNQKRVAQSDLFGKTDQARSENGKLNRLDAETSEFLGKVRKGFLAIAKKEKERFTVLDGDRSIETIFDEIKSCLIQRLKIKNPRG